MRQRLGANLQWPTVTEPIISPAPEHAAAASPPAARSPDGTPPPGVAYPKTIKSFVRRAGRTTAAQARAFEHLGPQLLLPYRESTLEPVAVFGRSAPLILEIGFGMGETTAKIAAAMPDHDFLAIDVHTPGVGALCKLIAEGNLSNVRVMQHDAVEVMRDMLGDGTLAGVHIFFPDPWPKKRHHKRRFVRQDNVEMLIACLKPEGRIQMATDHAEYFEQMRQVTSALCDELEEAEFVRPAGAAGEELTGTNYERKYIKDRRPIHVLAFRRKRV